MGTISTHLTLPLWIKQITHSSSATKFWPCMLLTMFLNGMLFHLLTHWGRETTADVVQTTFSYVISIAKNEFQSDNQSCLPLFEIMCTHYTICVYNLNFACAIFWCRDNYTIFQNALSFFLLTLNKNTKSCPEIMINQCVYSKIHFGNPVI